MKPDEIPQGVWDTALDVAWEADGTDHPFVVEPIARAIMAEREAVEALLKNPSAVRLNYLRGGIACQPLIDEAVAGERNACAKEARSAVMKFKSRVGGRYYAGYHEDMREFVADAIRNRP